LQSPILHVTIIKLDTYVLQSIANTSTHNRLEEESIDFRRQRDSVIDERDSLQKMVDRRNTELQRMQDDVKILNTQLKAAIDAKCEAIAKYEAVQSLEVSLEYK
jgi:nucleoprotein TPR